MTYRSRLTQRKRVPAWFSATSLADRFTYVAEPARAGSQLVYWYALPAQGRALDSRIPPRLVPLHLRRAARAILGEGAYVPQYT